MRGEDRGSQGFFSYVRLDERISADHPLRAIRDLIDEALRSCRPPSGILYAREGRRSIPPERLLRALLLQAALHTVRSERQSDGAARLQSIVAAVSSGCRPTIQCGMRRSSARIGTGCSTAILRASS